MRRTANATTAARRSVGQVGQVVGDELVAELGDQAVGRERRHREREASAVRRSARAAGTVVPRRRACASPGRDALGGPLRWSPMAADAADDRELVAEHRSPAGVRRVHVLAWRDLDDPDAGGSELHADEFMRRWAAAGLEIVHRTSAGRAACRRRPAATATRWSAGAAATRCSPARPVSELTGPDGPLRRPRRDLERRAVVLAGLVPPAPHDDPPPRPRPDVGPAHAAAAGRGRAVPGGPPGAAVLPLDPDGDAVGGHPPGAAGARVPARAGDGRRQRRRSVLLARRARWPRPDRRRRRPGWPPSSASGCCSTPRSSARGTVPDLRVRIVGEGPLRAELQAWIDDHDAGGWVELLGHVPRGQLRDEYRRAWVVGQRLARRGLGPVADRGRGVRDAGGGDRHQRPPLLGRRRRDGRAGAPPTTSAGAIGRPCSATTTAAVGWATPPWPAPAR